jgi:outer membrane biogenesis lipoprotein LolB
MVFISTKGIKTMKYLVLASILALAACSGEISDERKQEKHAADRQAHQDYLEEIYSNYDSEYVADCLFYEDLVCEFEEAVGVSE